MPNHCSTSMEVKGNYEHRQEFVDKNRGYSLWDTGKTGDYKALSFNAQVPMPKTYIKKHQKDKSNSEWYGWSNKQWGTKWDCYEEQCHHSEQYTSYSFDTAWSPPFPWIQKVSRKFPHLEFNITWAEEGGGGGYFNIRGGDLFYQRPMTEQEWKDYNGYEDDEE